MHLFQEVFNPHHGCGVVDDCHSRASPSWSLVCCLCSRSSSLPSTLSNGHHLFVASFKATLSFFFDDFVWDDNFVCRESVSVCTFSPSSVSVYIGFSSFFYYRPYTAHWAFHFIFSSAPQKFDGRSTRTETSSHQVFALPHGSYVYHKRVVVVLRYLTFRSSPYSCCLIVGWGILRQLYAFN